MKRGLTILLIAALLAVSAFCFIACKDKVEIPDGVELAIMSFNVRQDTTFDVDEMDWEFRKEYLVNHIKDQAPAVLGMQEVQKNQYEYISENLDGYETIWYSRAEDESQEGLAIAYNKDKFDLIEEDMFWLSETPNVESKGFRAPYLRICVHTVLKEIATGREISVYSVHLEVTYEYSRDKEVEMVIDKVKADERPTIVCGDFNTTYDSDCFRRMSEVLTSAQDSALETDDGISYQNFGGGFVSFYEAIDFIFLSDDFFAVDFDIIQEHSEKDGKDVYYSDHYPVMSNIVFKS